MCIYINACIIFFSKKPVLVKISSLRTYYSKEIGTVQNGMKIGHGCNDIYISKWAHFNSVAFLRDMVTLEDCNFDGKFSFALSLSRILKV